MSKALPHAMEALRALPLAQAADRLQEIKRPELQKLAKEAGTKVRRGQRCSMHASRLTVALRVSQVQMQFD